MRQAIKLAGCTAIGMMLLVAGSERAEAQVPVVVQPAAPAVVGYTSERVGLFGWRRAYRPIVAPVAAAPVVTAAPVVAARPVVTPVTSYYAPAAPVVETYYAPAAPVVAPVTTYRVPVPTYVPVIGY